MNTSAPLVLMGKIYYLHFLNKSIYTGGTYILLPFQKLISLDLFCLCIFICLIYKNTKWFVWFVNTVHCVRFSIAMDIFWVLLHISYTSAHCAVRLLSFNNSEFSMVSKNRKSFHCITVTIHVHINEEKISALLNLIEILVLFSIIQRMYKVIFIPLCLLQVYPTRKRH